MRDFEIRIELVGRATLESPADAQQIVNRLQAHAVALMQAEGVRVEASRPEFMDMGEPLDPVDELAKNR